MEKLLPTTAPADLNPAWAKSSDDKTDYGWIDVPHEHSRALRNLAISHFWLTTEGNSSFAESKFVYRFLGRVDKANGKAMDDWRKELFDEARSDFVALLSDSRGPRLPGPVIMDADKKIWAFLYPDTPMELKEVHLWGKTLEPEAVKV